jgi:class 3 adenylate cyclase/pimeloyl-ACP methyl ester carboxylesterase
MDREVRYCRSEDGTRIAYCVEGEGPALLMCPRNWESFANDLGNRNANQILMRGRTTVRYDFRGVGLSQRDPARYTLDCMTADVEAVVRSAGLSRFALWSSTFSVGAAITYAGRHPDDVARLIMARVVTRGAEVMPRQNLEALVALIRSNWEMASQALADMGIRRGDPSLGVRLAELYRQNIEPEAAAQMVLDLYETDILGVLPDIKCPVLVMHRKEDAPFPFAVAKLMAAMINNARLLALPGSGPVGIGDEAETEVRAMTGFLDEDPSTRALDTLTAVASEQSLRTVLFTDLVGHTSLMSRLGDARGRLVLREHESIARKVLKEHGGTEVKSMGEGFMASFGSVTRAVECAIALQRAFAAREGEALSVRVGLNAGEPIEEEGDLFGATVILASRIAARAEGGEILVADTVRGLCSGKGFLFADRGEFVAKGFEEPVRVYEVRWTE